MGSDLGSRVTIAGTAVAAAVGSIYVLSALVDFEAQVAAAPVALIVGGLIVGWGVGFQLAPVAIFLVALPPVWSSLPEDPWIGFFTLMILTLVYLPAVAVGAVAGAFLRMAFGRLRRV